MKYNTTLLWAKFKWASDFIQSFIALWLFINIWFGHVRGPLFVSFYPRTHSCEVMLPAKKFKHNLIYKIPLKLFMLESSCLAFLLKLRSRLLYFPLEKWIHFMWVMPFFLTLAFANLLFICRRKLPFLSHKILQYLCSSVKSGHLIPLFSLSKEGFIT